MKANVLKAVTVLVIVAIASSCSGIKFMTDQDNTIDFSQYKTYRFYGWAEESDKLINDLEQGRIEKAFGEEFDNRGMSLVKEGGDLVVTLYIVTEEKTKTTATTTHTGGYGYGYGYGGYYGYGPRYGWGVPMSHTTYNEYDYVEGTLIIDVYDAKEKRLIWESIAKGEVHQNPKGRAERIPKLVARMMQEYPVKPVE